MKDYEKTKPNRKPKFRNRIEPKTENFKTVHALVSYPKYKYQLQNRNGDLLYGFATFLVTLLPSMAAFIRKRNFYAAIHHLPFVHIWKKFQRCNKKRAIRSKIQYAKNLIKKSERSKDKAFPRILVDQYKQELSDFKVIGQVDSGYHSILESGTMYLLQACIFYEQYGYFGWLGYEQATPTQQQTIISSFLRY